MLNAHKNAVYPLILTQKYRSGILSTHSILRNEHDLYLQTLNEAKAIKRRTKKETDCSAGTNENLALQTRNTSFLYNIKVNGEFLAEMYL